MGGCRDRGSVRISREDVETRRGMDVETRERTGKV